ncbi:MAG: type II secretion system F family protein [Candidatus Bathyarchaeota archaeon]|nr:type II secretion system F family protein [Candidatus Bathyarchaeum tardum]WGM90051.1 MAG: type II secretion system F family protein [Candidatus Bathyarchaeum tardum]WNZ29812.1 MAG: type II secretion system F family protein [Candidatus Bathyarchaeota archaeon]
MSETQTFFQKLKARIAEETSEKKEEIDRELPFVVMLFALLSTSGVSLYDSWKRLRKMNLLPRFQEEAEELVRQVEVLGKDPLTAMYELGEKTGSKAYRDFLGGFVSTIKSGGKISDYMQSKLRVIFELRNKEMTRSTEKIATLVESYSVMLILILCIYILYSLLTSSTSMEQITGMNISSSPLMTFIIAFVAVPTISLLFLLVANNMHKSTMLNLTSVYKKTIISMAAATGVMVAFVFVPGLSEIGTSIGLSLLLTVFLVIGVLPGIVEYYKLARINYNAEASLPSFLRDITESQKTGISPEKSIIHATKRRDYGLFSQFLHLIRSQIEWGVSLKEIFRNIKQKISSWPVLVNFMMMVETIEVGGGSVRSLEILSEYSEKELESQINKRALLKPYVILAFVWSVLIALTTNIITVTMFVLNQFASASGTQILSAAMAEDSGILSLGIIFQCWLSGLFMGKISEGNIAAGLKYSAILTITAYISLIVSQDLLADLFGVVTF